ncbi:MAG TPA: hypothetical protein H9768_09165 [Candidatus Mailhella merdavium]|nr:hypothetical protein [Candidatus Mailhella merdavium]
MSDNKLLLEGDDDKHLVIGLLRSHMGKSVFDFHFPKSEEPIKVKGSVSKVISDLEQEITSTGYKHIGIIIDTDKDIMSSWGKIIRILKKCDISYPPMPALEGTIIDIDEDRRIGFWFMPNNQSPGALENFFVNLIRTSDDLWPRSKGVVKKIPHCKRRFRHANKSDILKAQVHTWLAWQHKPGLHMNRNKNLQYLDLNHPNALAFVNWIERLLA